MAKQLKNPAPMPRREEDINKSMKLYTYLICLSGVATYPENTRMFRQKNLCLTKIYRATGITDKTIKKYLWLLEEQGLVQYRGEIKFLNDEEILEIEQKLQSFTPQSVKYISKYNEYYGAALWKKRNKFEKNGVYYIPRPDPWTPIPESTLQELNEKFCCTEFEMKLYLTCVGYQDICTHRGENFQLITFEGLRDTFGYVKSSLNDAMIRRSLIFLKGLGLLDFQEFAYVNTKNASIPAFKLNQVNYYINYKIEFLKSKMEQTTDSNFIEAFERILKEEEKEKT